jgi:ATP-dependent Clp endopeptidase proteolytic subunit ClpP
MKKKGKKQADNRNSDLYLDPSEELIKRGVYYITNTIETDSLLQIHQDILLKHLDPYAWNVSDDVQLFINSYGGAVAETWALIDLLQWIRMDVKTTGVGACCSAGACLVACGTPGKRVLARNASVMIHGASGGLYGNVHQLASGMKEMKDEHDKDVTFWIQHSKYKTRTSVEKYLLDGKDHWFTAKEALDIGIVDAVVGLDAPPQHKTPRRKSSRPPEK